MLRKSDRVGAQYVRHYRPPASNTNCWAAKVARNRTRDEIVNKALTAAGWTVIRIWEHESPESAARRIQASVRGAPPMRNIAADEAQPDHGR
jgi:DNA mismatch endonuclease, patch repair protein